MSNWGNLSFIAPEIWPGIGLGLARHVAEALRMEVSLTSHIFKDIFYALDAPMAIVGLSGHPLLVNAALERVLEYSESELRRMQFAEFTHPQDVSIDTELFNELVTGARDKYTITKRWITKRGHTVWGFLTVSPITGDDGAIKAAVAVIHPIDAAGDVKVSRKLITPSDGNGNGGGTTKSDAMKKENFILAALREIAAMQRPFAVVGAAALFMLAVWLFFGGGLNRIIDLLAQ